MTVDGPVRQILVNDKGVVVLGAKDVHMASRRGPPIWHCRYVELTKVLYESNGLADRSSFE